MSLAVSPAASPVGDHLRAWRRRRRMSQLDLAGEAEISSRHLSFVETGRANPSRDMVLRLADRLDVPMRERNVLLVAAGYAPLFPESSLAAPELAAVREAVDVILQGHKPYPAFALDRHWDIIASNGALPELMAGVDPALTTPPINAIRLTLHPKGLARRIVNFAEWRGHMLHRLRRQIDLTADRVLIDLLAEVQAYGAGLASARSRQGAPVASEMVVPFRIKVGDDVLSFFTTTLVFGTPVEVTMSELAVESFFPADAQTAAIVRTLSGLPPR
jgi:transcriptional regulator with XRE-family HTH domain